MDKPIKKFVSSRFKFFLINSLVLFLLILILLSLHYLLNNEIFFIFTLAFSIFFLIAVFIIKTKFINWVYFHQDRFEFKNCYGRVKICRFSEILEVGKLTLSREGSQYFLITEKENNIFKINYPFKFDVNEKTTKIIKSFWNKEIKNYYES